MSTQQKTGGQLTLDFTAAFRARRGHEPTPPAASAAAPTPRAARKPDPDQLELFQDAPVRQAA